MIYFQSPFATATATSATHMTLLSCILCSYCLQGACYSATFVQDVPSPPPNSGSSSSTTTTITTTALLQSTNLLLSCCPQALVTFG
jgi:hypothetical protein